MRNRPNPGFLPAALTLAVCAAVLMAAAPRDSRSTKADAATALYPDTVLSASLTGAAEVPGPGDTNASGSATVTVEPGKGQVCYELTVSGLTDVTAAHIHEGAEGKEGPPVVVLDAPEDGSAKGCREATKEVIAALLEHPTDYYVNVHDKAHPNGAIRGQLMAKGM